jgi:hypothetical protein
MSLDEKIKEVTARIYERIDAIDNAKAGKQNGEARLVRIETQGIASRYAIEDAIEGVEYTERKRTVIMYSPYLTETGTHSNSSKTTIIYPPLRNVIKCRVVKAKAEAWETPNSLGPLMLNFNELVAHRMTHQFCTTDTNRDTNGSRSFSTPLFTMFAAVSHGRFTMDHGNTEPIVLDSLVPILASLTVTAKMEDFTVRLDGIFIEVEFTTLEPLTTPSLLND